MHPLWTKVETFYPQIWRAVCGYEFNHAIREELLQDVMLAIWESLPRLREPDRLLPFVLRIAHNLGASHVRSETRMPATVALDDRIHDTADHTRGDDAEQVRSQWLFQALPRLPLNLRQVLMLQLEGFDYEETANMLGITIENVGVRLHRARERLKALHREETSR